MLEKSKIDRSQFLKFEHKTHAFKSEMQTIRQLQKVNAASIESIAKTLHKTAARRVMSLVSSEDSICRKKYTS